MTTPEMAKAYEPATAEERWYPEWEARGYFHADSDDEREPYTIVIPPPNVTGVLHLGHVLNNTLQDILIRFEKMRGKNTCWIPGTDHAGIATQAKVERVLRETEGSTRHDLGREKFLERVWDWKDQYGGTIIRQLRTLGCGCDWTRERFTLDDKLSEAVRDVFIQLYHKGLIYQGTRMINWCPVSHTALSDEEVIFKNAPGKLWHIRYDRVDGQGSVIVATTRPETMLGDTGIAVHPEDERYTDLVGHGVILPIVDREIPVFADDYVKPEFGTGAVKVTPAHDPNDYEMGQRHDLETIDIMNDDASMNDHVPERFRGLTREAARKAVVAELEASGHLVLVEQHDHEVGFSERGDVPVEPRLSQQWFVRMESLAKPALEAVEDGSISFHPERHVKTYRHWLENIRDWCISRQLWWGHRIPAYHCASCSHINVAKDTPTACEQCESTALTQDPDVLDTWFSSWLWPFSVHDWPEESADLAKFYPTATLVTGPDIIFFWVARMIMAGLEFKQEIPFKDVYFTSIIRDEKGRKLSKSLGNSPDPVDVIAEYGADALRYAIIYIAPVGQDLRYSNKRCEIGRNFANKLWNATRFRSIQGPLAENWQSLDGLSVADLRPDDRWMLARLNHAITSATKNLETFDFHAYALDLYEFVWNEFCDWYVESAKAAFYGDDEAAKATALRVFDFALSRILRVMHPVIPFLTEELYHALGFVAEDDSIMLSTWPEPLSAETCVRLGVDSATEELVSHKFDLVRAGRNLRATYNIPFAKRVPYFVKPTDTATGELLAADPDSLRTLLNAASVSIDPDFEPEGLMPSAVGQGCLIYLPLEGVIDLEEEKARLDKQRGELVKGITGITKKLGNENFVSRAPESVVARERERRGELQEKLDQVDELAALLGG